MKVTQIPKPGKKKKKKRKQDLKYQAFIRSKSCCICGDCDTVVHHESLTGGSMGSKADDRQTIPLCVRCHFERHHYGRRTFYGIHDIDYKQEILKLNREYDDEEKQEKEKKIRYL